MRGGQGGDRLAVFGDGHAAFAGERAVAIEDGDLVLFQQMRHAAGELLGDAARAFDDFIEVEADVVGAEAEFIHMVQQVVDFRAAQ